MTVNKFTTNQIYIDRYKRIGFIDRKDPDYVEDSDLCLVYVEYRNISTITKIKPKDIILGAEHNNYIFDFEILELKNDFEEDIPGYSTQTLLCKRFEREYDNYKIIRYNTEEEWLKIRQQGIGGSDVAILMGLSSYMSPLELWREKVTGETEYTTSLPAERGKALEPVALNEYERLTGDKVDKIDGVLRSKEYPFMQASLDGYVKDKNILIEAKSVNTFAANQWGELDQDGVCETEEIPPNYYLQVQHYMIVAGMLQCVVVVYFTAIDKIGRYPIAIAEPSVQQQIIDREKDFWAAVNNDIPPTAESRDISITYPKSNGKAIEINPVIKCKYKQLVITEAKRKELEKEETELKDEIKLYLGNDEILTDGNDTLLTWKSAKSTNKLDTKALKEAHPDIHKEFTVEKEGSRRFLIKKVKDD